MEKEFVPYKIALKLKQIGFEEDCLAYYVNEHFKLGTFPSSSKYSNNQLYKTGNLCSAPLWQQAFRFLLDKLGEDVSFSIFNDYSGYAGIYNLREGGTFTNLKQGLELLIKLCKTEKK